jgi:NAD-dependent deacetylase
LRPDVVWFGELLPEEAWETAESASTSCDLFLSVGTSAVVHPVAGLVDVATAAGALTAEVNVEATSAQVEHRLVGPAGVVLPRLLREAFGGAPDIGGGPGVAW